MGQRMLIMHDFGLSQGKTVLILEGQQTQTARNVSERNRQHYEPPQPDDVIMTQSQQIRIGFTEIILSLQLKCITANSRITRYYIHWDSGTLLMLCNGGRILKTRSVNNQNPGKRKTDTRIRRSIQILATETHPHARRSMRTQKHQKGDGSCYTLIKRDNYSCRNRPLYVLKHKNETQRTFKKFLRDVKGDV